MFKYCYEHTARSVGCSYCNGATRYKCGGGVSVDSVEVSRPEPMTWNNLLVSCVLVDSAWARACVCVCVKPDREMFCLENGFVPCGSHVDALRKNEFSVNDSFDNYFNKHLDPSLGYVDKIVRTRVYEVSVIGVCVRARPSVINPTLRPSGKFSTTFKQQVFH